MIYSYCIAINMARDEDFIVLTLQYSHQSVSLSRRRLCKYNQNISDSNDDNSNISGGDEYSIFLSTAVCTTHDHHHHHGDYHDDRLQGEGGGYEDSCTEGGAAVSGCR